MKKQNQKTNMTGIWIAAAIIIAAIIIAPNLNFEFFSTINQDTIHQLDQAPDGDECYVTLDKNIVNVGDEVGGLIHNGANTHCEIYGSDGTTWNLVGEGTTNANGDLRYSDVINIPGTFMFRAICGTCVTNIVNLVVNPVDIPPEEGFEPGDVVGSGGSDVTLGDGGMSTFEINFVPTDEQFDMCAEIERRSSKVDPNCNPTGDLEDWNEFVFLDSYDVVWERSDQLFAGISAGPNTFGNPDIVGVRWDGSTPFKGHMYHYGPCDMKMEMRVTIVVC